MLGSLTGTVTARLGQRILVDVSGVGYWVYTGAWQPDGLVTCYLYHHVREEADDLYGFESVSVLSLFEQLISVSGIGPKAGLAVLSLGDAERIAAAIAAADISFLSLAPGIGKKAAEKIILELRNKVTPGTPSVGSTLHDDLRAALEGLGYKVAELQPYLSNIPSEHSELDAQLKWVLQQLGK